MRLLGRVGIPACRQMHTLNARKGKYGLHACTPLSLRRDHCAQDVVPEQHVHVQVDAHASIQPHASTHACVGPSRMAPHDVCACTQDSTRHPSSRTHTHSLPASHGRSPVSQVHTPLPPHLNSCGLMGSGRMGTLGSGGAFISPAHAWACTHAGSQEYNVKCAGSVDTLHALPVDKHTTRRAVPRARAHQHNPCSNIRNHRMSVQAYPPAAPVWLPTTTRLTHSCPCSLFSKHAPSSTSPPLTQQQ